MFEEKFFEKNEKNVRGERRKKEDLEVDAGAADEANLEARRSRARLRLSLSLSLSPSPTFSGSLRRFPTLSFLTLSGRGDAETLSFPITTNVPSFRRVINIRLSTGIAKKLGQGPDAASPGSKKALALVGDFALNLLGGSANALMKKKSTR